MYGVEWLIVLGILGLAIGGAGGYLLARRSGDGRRKLEQELESARRELDDYRGAVVREFSETARKFQTLNDAYTDLHEQLARSSSTLCGDITGPLLEAPAGHQDVIPADVRDQVQTGRLAAAATAPSMAASAAEQGAARSAPDHADDAEATAPDATATAETRARAEAATTPDAGARAEAGETLPADATTDHPAQASDAPTERPASDGSADAAPAAPDPEPEIRVREPAAAAGGDGDIPTLTEEPERSTEKPERRAADIGGDSAVPGTATGADYDRGDAAERAEARRRAASGH